MTVFNKEDGIGVKKTDKAQVILESAEQLFLTNGYKSTSMREISAASGVGLGLITYHYKTKAELAKACIREHFKIIDSMVSSAVDFKEDVLLFHATYLRFANWYFLRPEMREFYYECLEEGIYGDYIFETVPRTLREINRKYAAGYSDDYILLYGNFVPVDLERTLILQKRKGLFSQISEEDIPTVVFETAVSRFVPDKTVIWAAIQKSITLCAELAKQFEDKPEAPQ